MTISQRKNEHIRIVLEENVRSGLSNGLDKYQFVHNALPELDYKDIDPSIQFFNHRLNFPLLISSMTGGTEKAGRINQNLAIAAQKMRIALAVGSQRAGLEDPQSEKSFQVREFAPDVLLFANIGAVQLNYGYSVDECQKTVEMIQANVLYLHLNPLQEALQPEGNTNFKELLKKIEMVCKKMTVPVVVKEVGWGISGEVAKQLASAGVAAIDVAGAGGTSWSQVEKFRLSSEMHRRVAASFNNWGLPTAESLVEVKNAVPGMELIASGGLQSGIDLAKCISLGASLGGMAGHLLKVAVESEEKTILQIEEVLLQMKICMFACGVRNLSDLKKARLIKV